MASYIPVDEGKVPEELRAFAELTLKDASYELGMVDDYSLRWFADTGNPRYPGGLRDSFVQDDCLGFTGRNNDWKTIWVKVTDDPRQIVQVVAHEMEHIRQFARHGAALVQDDATRKTLEQTAYDYGVAYKNKMLPLSTDELRQKAADVLRKYGG